MQEEYIKDICDQIKPDLDEKILGLHPSSNHVFRDEGTLENIAMFPTKYLSDLILKGDSKLEDKQKKYALTDKTAKWLAVGGLRGLIYVVDFLQKGLSHIVYAGTEATSRIVESGIRGTKRGICYLAEKAYNQFDEKEESWFKKKINSVKNQYNNLAGKASSWYQGLDRNRKKQLKRYGQGTWNHLVSAGSVTLGATMLLSLCSSGEPEQRVEEPTAIVETARETTRQSERARNQYLRESELRTSSTPTRVQRGIPEPRPVQRQPQRICSTPDLSRNLYNIVADAAMDRAVAQRFNYSYMGAPTSPMPGLTSNTTPGHSVLEWLRNRNKCNQFVGDTLVQAGYDVPVHEMSDRSRSLHYKEIEQFPHETEYFRRITDFCDIRPGHVIVIDYPGQGESTAHGEVVHDVDYRTRTVKSFGAHADGAYKKTLDLFARGTFSSQEGCWRVGGSRVYVLEPIKRR